MKIVTWSSTDAPATHAWAARFLVDGGFLPIIFTGAAEDDVRSKAKAFWDAETEKGAARKVGKPRTAQQSIEDRFGKAAGAAVEDPFADLIG